MRPAIPVARFVAPVVASLLVIGCAVEASPAGPRETSSEVSTSRRDPSPEITIGPISPIPHLCYNTPLTFEPSVSCTLFSYATTPDTSYASCGMTSATFSTPSCASSGDFAWDVLPGGVQNLQTYASLSPTLCAMYYADMELWTQSASTGKWQEIASGRKYGTPYTSGGKSMCNPPYLNSELASLEGISQVTLWADVYGPELTLSGVKTVPQVFSIRVSADR